MDEVFKALADASRRRLLDSLNTRNGQTLRELCTGLDMARQSVSKHLAVLEDADLVTTMRRGREKLHYLNAAPINAIADRWMSRYDRERANALADLKTALEQDPMSEFVYTTYIRTTPERLWQALTAPAFTRRYWGVAFETDWAPGSTITWHEESATMADPEQVVLEADPPRRLSYTWHTFTPEWAKAVGVDEETRLKLLAEPRSKVTFDIEASGETVKLTVVHAAGDALLDMSRHGWPQVLSGLKTLLETGEPLPAE
ncbi:metalloregulator ArsR/SmtB family transcription factor [Actinomadura soli]|uniref:Metalloregulator ArsR/SmtB family transcription factor n=1 Tax=Actinomadura soli TaxID=2508997 RepID=A0A5C4JGX5_9ACTN|nr:metalloregulator ArsR/SmtB family transcription factor [Actinomadura soli]TMR04728.1 metalloregulator ArsR/SmtB family transcription factor [Actinomadura soli]